MGVSKNMGTPKSFILIGFSIINHPFWGTPILGNIHIYTVREQESMAVLIAKIGTIFVPRTLPHRRILFQRSLQRPQACSLLWPGPHRDAVYYGRDRTGTFITIWPGPHRDRADTLIYGRDRTETLFTMAGTAPGRSLLWPGPHRDTHYYGRDRTGTALTHSLLWWAVGVLKG